VEKEVEQPGNVGPLAFPAQQRGLFEPLHGIMSLAHADPRPAAQLREAHLRGEDELEDDGDIMRSKVKRSLGHCSLVHDS
jgi:hypothetical protein